MPASGMETSAGAESVSSALVPSQSSCRRPTAFALLAWTATLGWLIVISLISHQPGDPDMGSGRLRFGIEKVGHLTVYAVLAMLVLLAFGNQLSRRRRLWWTLVIVASYAVLDELHQSVVPGRSPTVMDVAIDIIGGMIGIVVVDRVSRWSARRSCRRRRSTVTIGHRERSFRN